MPVTVDDPLVAVDDPNVDVSGNIISATEFIFEAAGETVTRLWHSLGRGITQEDEALGYPLLWWLYCMTGPLQVTDEVVRDTDDAIGWSSVLDVDTCPDRFLPWLGQFVGAVLTPGLTTEEWRTEIREVKGWKRGTPNAIIEATKRTLIGNKSVRLTERYGGDPYVFQVQTFSFETPFPTLTQATVFSEKPAGLVAIVNTRTTATIRDLENAFARIQDVENTFVTILSMETWRPSL